MNVVGEYRGAFSPDGMYVGVVKQNQLVQLRDAATGRLITELHGGTQAGPFWYDISFSTNGYAALGGLGRVDVHDASFDRLIATFACGGCRVIDAVEFSPDGRLLAYQELRTLPERIEGLGSVYVVDLLMRTEAAKLAASTGRAKLAFTANREKLFATVTEHPADGGESLGFQSWRTSDWTALDRSVFDSWSMGTFAVGLVGDATLVAYANDGRLEARNLDDGRVVWNVPLVPALFAPEGIHVRAVELDRIAFARDGRFLITYESPVAADFFAHQAGAVVVRRSSDGQVVAIYDVHGVTDIDIAADSKTFLFSAGFHRPQVAVARVPALL